MSHREIHKFTLVRLRGRLCGRVRGAEFHRDIPTIVDNCRNSVALRRLCYHLGMIILASQSAVRKKLLQDAGVAFDVIKSTYDETYGAQTFRPGPETCMAEHLAAEKAVNVSRGIEDALVIGADQTLHCDSELFHKPGNRDIARDQLLKLRGKTHVLTSAVVCSKDSQILWTNVSEARITMRDFSEKALENYLNSAGDAVFQAVGSYHFEGTGVQLMDSVAGDYHTILGFPLLPLLGFLRVNGYLAT